MLTNEQARSASEGGPAVLRARSSSSDSNSLTVVRSLGRSSDVSMRSNSGETRFQPCTDGSEAVGPQARQYPWRCLTIEGIGWGGAELTGRICHGRVVSARPPGRATRPSTSSTGMSNSASSTLLAAATPGSAF